MAVLATLCFSPAPGARTAPVSVVAFSDGTNLLKTMGRSENEHLNLQPFAALFPKQVGLAWAYAEWVDWLEASLLDERLPFDEFSRQLEKPSMQALTIKDVVPASGDLSALVQARFSSSVLWPTADLSASTVRRLIDEQIFSLVGEMAEQQGLATAEDGPTIGWDVGVTGRLTGMVATKISGLKEAPPKAVPRILQGLPRKGADKYLVITDMPNLVLPLAQNGVESIVFNDAHYLTKLAAWLASLV